jgi:hypothetical protein
MDLRRPGRVLRSKGEMAPFFPKAVCKTCFSGVKRHAEKGALSLEKGLAALGAFAASNPNHELSTGDESVHGRVDQPLSIGGALA